MFRFGSCNGYYTSGGNSRILIIAARLGNCVAQFLQRLLIVLVIRTIVIFSFTLLRE